jgi:hypothetical protein
MGPVYVYNNVIPYTYAWPFVSMSPAVQSGSVYIVGSVKQSHKIIMRSQKGHRRWCETTVRVCFSIHWCLKDRAGWTCRWKNFRKLNRTNTNEDTGADGLLLFSLFGTWILHLLPGAVHWPSAHHSARTASKSKSSARQIHVCPISNNKPMRCGNVRIIMAQ